VALYNHRQFFRCHEALEQIWLKTQGQDRNFYKGLIQAAVAFYHWSKGNRAGALSLYRSSSRYLAAYPGDAHNLDLAGFLKAYRELFEWLKRHPLAYDARLVPPLRPVHDA
jgi:predicted metal-dependent hydrolase